MAVVLALVLLSCANAQITTRSKPSWQPRWLVEVAGNVWSPGGVDKNQFTTSLGGSLSLIYWINWDTQLLVSGALASLKTDAYNWLPFDAADTSITLNDVNVKGSLRVLSVEARKLFPSDRQNFLYLGLGFDYFSFGEIKGSYQRTDVGNPTPFYESFTTNRDPSSAVGAHVTPGLFFLLYPKIPVDIAIRFNGMYDGDHTMIWVEPMFGIGYRIQ
jgi:hypothetical protein